MKIRGTALHIAEKYSQLSRDAQSSGDRIMAENYLQHAEHYYRIVAAAQPQSQPREDSARDGRFDDQRYNGDRGQSFGAAEHGDGDGDGEEDEYPRVNGHAARPNGAAANGARNIADEEQPTIDPPEHFERGGVDNVNQGRPTPDPAPAPSTDPERETSQSDSPRRRRIARAPRVARARGQRTASADSPEAAPPPATPESDTTPGDA